MAEKSFPLWLSLGTLSAPQDRLPAEKDSTNWFESKRGETYEYYETTSNPNLCLRISPGACRWNAHPAAGPNQEKTSSGLSHCVCESGHASPSQRRIEFGTRSRGRRFHRHSRRSSLFTKWGVTGAAGQYRPRTCY